MNNMEKLLATTVDKVCWNTSGFIVDRFIKPIESTMFGHLVYLVDGPGMLIEIAGPHEEFFNIDFGIWIGGMFFQMVSEEQQGCTNYVEP